MPLVEKRYAEALIDISIKEGALDIFQDELQAIVGIYDNHPDLKRFLLSHEIKPIIRKEALQKLFSGQIRPKMLSFLMFLLDKGRISCLPLILKEYVKLADEKRNTLKIAVISPAPLDEIQLERIKEKYRVMYNASSVKAVLQIDRSLIGGIKVKIGDKIYDSSLKGRLESLKELLINS